MWAPVAVTKGGRVRTGINVSTCGSDKIMGRPEVATWSAITWLTVWKCSTSDPWPPAPGSLLKKSKWRGLGKVADVSVQILSMPKMWCSFYQKKGGVNVRVPAGLLHGSLWLFWHFDAVSSHTAHSPRSISFRRSISIKKKCLKKLLHTSYTPIP